MPFEVALMAQEVTLLFWPSFAVWLQLWGLRRERVTAESGESKSDSRSLPGTFHLSPDVSIAYNVRLESRGCGRDRLVI